MRRSVAVCLSVLALAGCQSRPVQPYVSPRVTGQVLSAENGKPLPGVQVIRQSPRRKASLMEPMKGAELLIEPAPAITDQGGYFSLPSERVLTPFPHAAWRAVTLSFERPGYRPFHTNWSLPRPAATTNSPPGEPRLDLGVIRLQPATK